MKRVVEAMGKATAAATVHRTGGPERVAVEEAQQPPVRRYVGFQDPSPAVEEPVEEGTACPGVW